MADLIEDYFERLVYDHGAKTPGEILKIKRPAGPLELDAAWGRFLQGKLYAHYAEQLQDVWAEEMAAAGAPDLPAGATAWSRLYKEKLAAEAAVTETVVLQIEPVKTGGTVRSAIVATLGSRFKSLLERMHLT